MRRNPFRNLFQGIIRFGSTINNLRNFFRSDLSNGLVRSAIFALIGANQLCDIGFNASISLGSSRRNLIINVFVNTGSSGFASCLSTDFGLNAVDRRFKIANSRSQRSKVGNNVTCRGLCREFLHRCASTTSNSNNITCYGAIFCNNSDKLTGIGQNTLRISKRLIIACKHCVFIKRQRVSSVNRNANVPKSAGSFHLKKFLSCHIFLPPSPI